MRVIINCFIQHIDALKLYFPYHNSGLDFNGSNSGILSKFGLGNGIATPPRDPLSMSCGNLPEMTPLPLWKKKNSAGVCLWGSLFLVSIFDILAWMCGNSPKMTHGPLQTTGILCLSILRSAFYIFVGVFVFGLSFPHTGLGVWKAKILLVIYNEIGYHCVK